MTLHPAADIARRVWRPCAHCPNDDALYLLETDASLVHVQCGVCHTCWWLDTGYGAARRRP